MTKYTRRDWYIFNLGSSVTGALVGAVVHSAGIVIWNLVFIGYSIYVLETMGEEK